MPSVYWKNYQAISIPLLPDYVVNFKRTEVFSVSTDVYFRTLSREEIEAYVDVYQPYDKAGAYGIQEWIGYIGIERIEGSFYNVMGLPVQTLYSELKKLGITFLPEDPSVQKIQGE